MDCKKCGACCRRLILEIQHLDVVREPKLLEHAQLMDADIGEYESDREKEYSLADVGPCPMLGSDNKCSIYSSRPNMCVLMEPGSDQCRLARGEQTEATCRKCGCTDSRACPGGCYWVEPDICSRCHEKT